MSQATPLDSTLVVVAGIVCVLLVLTAAAIGFHVFAGSEQRGSCLRACGRGLASLLWALPVLGVMALVIYLSLARESRHVDVAVLKARAEDDSRSGVSVTHVAVEGESVDSLLAPAHEDTAHDHADADSTHAHGSDAEEAELAAIPSEPAPVWVEKGRYEAGDTIWEVVTGGYFVTRDEALQSAAEKARQLVKTEFSRRNSFPGRWELPTGVVREHAVQAEYVEVEDRDLGPATTTMYRAHLQVALTPELWDEVRPVWRQQVVTQRLWGLGAVTGLLALVVGSLATYLRVDAATEGRYRGRLKFATVSAIVAGGLLLATLA